MRLSIVLHRHRCNVEELETFLPARPATHEFRFTPCSRVVCRTWNEAQLTPPCPRTCPPPCRSAGTTRTPACQPTLSPPMPSSFSASRQHCSWNSRPQAKPFDRHRPRADLSTSTSSTSSFTFRALGSGYRLSAYAYSSGIQNPQPLRFRLSCSNVSFLSSS